MLHNLWQYRIVLAIDQKEVFMKILPLILTAFLAFSCAAKKIAAKNADVIIENQIKKRIPLYPTQKSILSKDVDKFLNDQKEFAKKALPTINSVELDVEKVDQQYDTLNILYQNLSQNFSALMSKYMGILDDKQQKELMENLKEENKKMAETSGNERMKKIYERFETLFGSMSDEQKKFLKGQKSYLDERNDIRLKRRENLHAQFKKIYEMDIPKESLSDHFQKAFNDYQDSYPSNSKNKEIIKSIIPTLSKEQKKHFKEKTQDLNEILGYYLDTAY